MGVEADLQHRVGSPAAQPRPGMMSSGSGAAVPGPWPPRRCSVRRIRHPVSRRQEPRVRNDCLGNPSYVDFASGVGRWLMHPLLLASRALAPSTLSYLSSPALCCALAIVVAAPERAAGDDEAPIVIDPRVAQSMIPELTAGAPVFKICRDQTYALCAVASCYVFDQSPIANATSRTATVSACPSRSTARTSATSTPEVPPTATWSAPSVCRTRS